MTEPAISVRGLSKRYRLGAISRHTLADEITYLYHKLRGRNAAEHMGKIKTTPKPPATRANARLGAQDFWALKDVSFDVQPGEIIGIVGGNGAGKSTLLKILSQITEPTEGEAFINGRVGSLLEVGTGFHPELTGRENIFMSGTIQGMKKAEIIRKFDEIVAFSEIDQFLDTPVKRYSSGMFVRLAFAVAAHLDPEILIVDEVLAVGDVTFQKKCLGKMGDVARQGRTILFVSHNMAAVENLCTHALWLAHGQVRKIGETSTIVDEYLSEMQATSRTISIKDRQDRQGTGKARIVDFFVTDEHDQKQTTLRPGETYQFHLICELSKAVKNIQRVTASIALTDHRNETIWLVHSNFTHEDITFTTRLPHLVCTVRDFNVAEGIYHASLGIGFANLEFFDHLLNASEIIVEGGDFFGTGSKGNTSLCKTLTRASWKTN
jgi:lipopolysaccharide transport system ATP-binding protein